MISIMWHGPEPNEEWRARAIKEGEDMIEGDLARAEDLIFHDVWDETPDERPRIVMWGEEGDVSFHAEFLPKGTKNSECQKCGGSGHYHYDNNQATFCDECCTHDDGWWELSEEGYGEKGFCCKRGCGTVVQEKPVEKCRTAPGEKED